MFLAIVAMIIIILILVTSTIYTDIRRRFNINVLFRVLMNHLQLMFLTISFKFDWPSEIEKLFVGLEPLANLSSHAVSFDCLFDTRNDGSHQSTKFPLFYYKLILTSAIPWGLIITTWIIWEIVYRTKSKGLKEPDDGAEIHHISLQVKSMRSTTAFVMMFLIHPTLLSVLFSMFNCYEIDGVEYLVSNMETECYTGLHLILLLVITVPSIIFFGLGIPFASFIVLFHKRDSLENERVQKELGFLFNGYRPRTYFWESYIMVRKLVIVFVLTYLSTKGKIYQLLVVFLLLSVCLAIQGAFQPFREKNFNTIEILSILASFFTIYAGYYFVVGNDPGDYSVGSRKQFKSLEFYNVVFLLVVILFQLLFFTAWCYQLHLEIKCWIFYRHTNLYNKVYNCNDMHNIDKDNTRRLRQESEKLRKSLYLI